MNTPIEGTGTSATQIVFTYLPLTDLSTGGDDIDILSYNSEVYDSANSAWVELEGETSDYTSLTVTFVSGTPIPIVSGETYQIRVRAENIYGFGEYSETVLIKAD